MTNIKLIPLGGKATTMVANGRTYTCAANVTIDVPDFDAFVLTANGFIAVAGSVGATSARPTNPGKGQTYHDTTLGLTIVFEGTAWQNPANGAVV